MSNIASEPIHRHRTAMVRHTLSQPMSLLVRHRLIREGVRVFDYGCGQGDDLRSLAAAGVEASGWDPHFSPQSPLTPAPVVNLGFVLNVIEDADERVEAIRTAWGLTTGVLAISTMVMGQVPTEGLRVYGDGFLTSRGTFQKYFQHGELKAWIAQTLGAEPVAVAPGIFLLFRHPEDEQDFLLERRRGRRASTAAYRTEPRRRAAARPELSDRISAALDEIADFALRRGRLPHPDELSSASSDQLHQEHVSFARALDVCRDIVLDASELENAAMAMREDLLVHQALGILNRTRSASRPSPMMIRDIRTLFGSQRELAEQAMEYLHALADVDRTLGAVGIAADAGQGLIDEEGRLVVNGDKLEDLPGILRCYVGCAVHLSGEVDGVHLVRLDPRRKRVALFPIDKPREPFPTTDRTIFVDLRRQDVFIKRSSRRLLRKADLFGMAAKSKQRRAERDYCATNGIAQSVVIESIRETQHAEGV